jgi:hypothetical protein
VAGWSQGGVLYSPDSNSFSTEGGRPWLPVRNSSRRPRPVSCAKMWEHKTGDRLGPAWDTAFLDWIKKRSFGLVADAVQQVAAPRYSDDGERVSPNIIDVQKYAVVLQADEAEPGMLDCYLVRGRMRKKFYFNEDDGEVLAFLRTAMRAGVRPSEMHRAVDENETLEDCFAALGVDRTEFRIAMGHPIDNRPQRRMVFIREDEPEWRLWDEHLRKTTGKGSPMNKHFGWHFPARMPPVDEPNKRRSR